jgi:hypothetical protein
MAIASWKASGARPAKLYQLTARPACVQGLALHGRIVKRTGDVSIIEFRRLREPTRRTPASTSSLVQHGSATMPKANRCAVWAISMILTTLAACTLGPKCSSESSTSPPR